MRRARLSDAVVAEIAGDILAGHLSPGTVLPSEFQLCERFDVSRTVVREAMGHLAREGLIRVRQGRGTAVLDRTHWNELSADLLHVRAQRGLINDLLPDLLEIRRLIEVEVARLAADRRDEMHLTRLGGLIAVMMEHLDVPEEYNDADVAFHEALMAAAGNELLRKLMRPVSQVRRIGTAIMFSQGKNVALASLSGHREIFDAVAKRDPIAAGDAMARHLADFERFMSQVLSDADGESVLAPIPGSHLSGQRPTRQDHDGHSTSAS